MKKYSLYRDGDWVEPSIDDYIEVENPATKEIIAQVPAAQELDVKLAIRGAKKAFLGIYKTVGREHLRII